MQGQLVPQLDNCPSDASSPLCPATLGGLLVCRVFLLTVTGFYGDIAQTRERPEEEGSLSSLCLFKSKLAFSSSPRPLADFCTCFGGWICPVCPLRSLSV